MGQLGWATELQLWGETKVQEEIQGRGPKGGVRKQAGSHSYWRDMQGGRRAGKGKMKVGDWVGDRAGLSDWFAVGRGRAKDSFPLDRQGKFNTPMVVKHFIVYSVFDVFTHLVVELSYGHNGTVWKKLCSSNQKLWTLGSGFGKLGIFCTKVAAEMKPCIHLQGRNFTDKWDENITVML